MEQSKTYEEYVKAMELIMDNFEFEKVRAYMLITDWKWWEDGEMQLPTIDKLKEQASYSLMRVIDSEEPSSNCGSGGFTAYKLPWGLKLSFEPFKYSSF